MPSGDPFDTLGVAPRFGIGEAEIRRAWMRRALDVHPDREGDASRSAEVNAALEVLRDPVSRAEALLRRLGPIEGGDPPASPEFLVEMIELRERLDESRGSIEGAASVRAEAEARLAAVFLEIGEAFDAESAPPADAHLVRRIRALLGSARALRRVLEHVDSATEAARPT